MSTSRLRFHRFALAALASTLGVVLWGAYVRASGSGAGCGSHWPTCNGEVFPRSPSVQTLIEYSHRVTSGVAFLLVAATLVWALRTFGSGHRVRKAAGAAMFLMITEALVGAGLVLFEMVADNQSIARAWWMSGHLINTFFLLAAQGLTVWWSRPGPERSAPMSEARGGGAYAGSIVGLVGLLAVAVTGAIAALGDTLFPAQSLAHGIASDLSPSSHLLLRLRVAHPILAIVVGGYLLGLAGHVARRSSAETDTRRATSAVGSLVVVQVLAGLINLVLLAPIWMQIVHLLLADLLWLSLVILSAQLASERAAHAPLMSGRPLWSGAVARRRRAAPNPTADG
jgi:heme a synthase